MSQLANVDDCIAVLVGDLTTKFGDSNDLDDWWWRISPRPRPSIKQYQEWLPLSSPSPETFTESHMVDAKAPSKLHDLVQGIRRYG